MKFSISNLRKEFRYWDMISAMIDQNIDIALNLSQSGHPGGSRSKVPVLNILCSAKSPYPISEIKIKKQKKNININDQL